MAVSKPALAIIITSLQSLLILYAIPHHLPSNPLSKIFAIALIFNFTALIIYQLWIYPFCFAPLRHLPSPKGLGNPLYGHHLAMFEKPPGGSFYKWMHEIKNDGLIAFRGLFNVHVLLVTSPAVLAEILVAKSYMFEKPTNGRDLLREVLGDGLVVVEGDAHKFQRKNLMPSFSFRHLKNLYPMMLNKAHQLTQRVEAQFEGETSITIDIVDWASRSTLDIIGVAGLGRDFNTVANADDPLSACYTLLGKPTPIKQVWFALMVMFGPDLVRRIPLPINDMAMKTKRELRVISRQLVQDKKEAIAKRGDDHVDILSILIKSGNFADEELVDQMLTFLGAGHDTTSLTFTWVCFILAKYPEIQKRLREELRSVKDELVVNNQDDGHLASVLEGLPYLNAVFHETLRVYPTVPLTQRVCRAETTLAGTRIPYDTHIVLSMMAVNRSPEFWGPDAAEFKPERWIDSATGKPNNHGGAESNYSLLTFLHGPRSCIGQNFARAELRCLLAAWVLKYNLEFPYPNYEPVASGAITMKPMGGMNLKVSLIDGIDDEKA